MRRSWTSWTAFLSIPSDESEISVEEKRLRKWLTRLYRFLLSTFVCYQTFDFLFSPLWMHGYLWSLNQQIDVDLADKSAGFIVDRQLGKVPVFERVVHCGLSVLGICLVLSFCGYLNRSKSTWDLFGLSAVCGAMAGLVRCQQMQQRLFSVLHESFYCYFNFFVVGMIMTLQLRRNPTIQENASVNVSEYTAALSAKEE